MERIAHGVVMFSGGGGSWAAAHRFAERYGVERMTLLFTDVRGDDLDNEHLGEDEDTYRFVREGADDLGAPLVWLRDGRSIYDVFYERGWLGNASLSHCSWELKTLPARRWLDEHCDPATTAVVVGMDWTEAHRHAAVYRNYAHTLDGCANPAQCRSLFGEDGRRVGPGCRNLLPTPWRTLMPMAQRPYVAKPQVVDDMKRRGLRPPRMYALGFAHANCRGCVKGGQAHWRRVLEVWPKTFAYHERREQEFRASKPNRANAAILKESRTVDGKTVTTPLPLTELRRRVEANDTGTLDLDFDWGGCGCGVGAPPEDGGRLAG